MADTLKGKTKLCLFCHQKYFYFENPELQANNSEYLSKVVCDKCHTVLCEYSDTSERKHRVRLRIGEDQQTDLLFDMSVGTGYSLQIIWQHLRRNFIMSHLLYKIDGHKLVLLSPRFRKPDAEWQALSDHVILNISFNEVAYFADMWYERYSDCSDSRIEKVTLTRQDKIAHIFFLTDTVETNGSALLWFFRTAPDSKYIVGIE